MQTLYYTRCVLGEKCKARYSGGSAHLVCFIRLFLCKTKTVIYFVDVLLMVRAGNASHFGQFCQNVRAVLQWNGRFPTNFGTVFILFPFEL